ACRPGRGRGALGVDVAGRAGGHAERHGQAGHLGDHGQPQPGVTDNAIAGLVSAEHQPGRPGGGLPDRPAASGAGGGVVDPGQFVRKRARDHRAQPGGLKCEFLTSPSCRAVTGTARRRSTRSPCTAPPTPPPRATRRATPPDVRTGSVPIFSSTTARSFSLWTPPTPPGTRDRGREIPIPSLWNSPG